MIKGMISRIYTGVKKGILTPTLPEHIIKLNNNPIIRFFKVLGGISILLILTKMLDYLGDSLLYFYVLVFCTILAILFSMYHIFLTYHRIKHIIKVLKSDELNVRKYPLDRNN
jgi:tellurite resistance protein TehA-like permease